jgi:hypothetical protein
VDETSKIRELTSKLKEKDELLEKKNEELVYLKQQSEIQRNSLSTMK